MGEGCVVALETGAAANSVYFKWLENRNLLVGKQELPRISNHPGSARFEFGDGRFGEVRHAAEVTDGSAGRKGTLTALVLEADIIALLKSFENES